MFLPIGDNVSKRNFPAVGVILVAVNFLVYAYQTRLWYDFVGSVRPKQTARPRTPNKTREPQEQMTREQLIGAFKDSDYYRFNQKWGASPKNVKAGHVMCLCTHLFLHGDFFHILGNMLVLWAFVGSLENALGSGRFLAFYFLWGVLAAAAELGLHWNVNDYNLIGASGAIAGMIGGYFIVFGALAKIRCIIWLIFYPLRVNVPAGVFVFFWILSQLSGLEDQSRFGDTHIAWVAHLGGFAAGAALLLILKKGIMSRMVRDRYGILHIRDAEEAPPAATEEIPQPDLGQQPPEEPSGLPSSCPNCGAALSEANRIHESMLRCPNPACQKLILLQ